MARASVRPICCDGDEMSSLSITEVIVSGDAGDLTDDQLRQFRDNPELFELISDRETLSLRNLWRLLGLAAGLVALSKILSISIGDEYDQFILTIMSDLVFEMGAALIGSIATVIFIQFQEKRQFEENVKFRAEVKKRIAALDAAGG